MDRTTFEVLLPVQYNGTRDMWLQLLKTLSLPGTPNIGDHFLVASDGEEGVIDYILWGRSSGQFPRIVLREKVYDPKVFPTSQEFFEHIDNLTKFMDWYRLS